MKKRTYGTGSVRQTRKGLWELRFTPKNSTRQNKYVEVQTKKEAEDELSEWRKELDRQAKPGVKVPCSELFDLHLADMRRRQRSARNILDQKQRIAKHLAPFFGTREASTVTVRDLNRYVDARLSKGTQPATINREMSALRRAFACGLEQHVIVYPLPKYNKLPEDNVREGFVEVETYRLLMQHLPRHLHMLWCFAYYFGIRRGELLQFRWEWLLPYWKERERILKIPGKYCKNKKPHTIPLYHPEMIAFLEIALTERELACPYLFQFRGKQLKSFRTAFENARAAAGLPELLFHDMRRTAIRNMIQAGISEKRAMQISGHRTRSVFDRYDITTEKDAIETGRHMRRHWEMLAEQEAADLQRQLAGQKLGDKLGGYVTPEAGVTKSTTPRKHLN